ncbi:MAG: FHA domain-containing protein [Blastocatellia bacterium]
MAEVILTISSPAGKQRRRITNGRLTIGRAEGADVVIDDAGLSRLHASIHCDGEKVWVLDEASRNGSYVNGEVVGASGAPLADGARIEIGNETSIFVEIPTLRNVTQSKSTDAKTKARFVPVVLMLSLVAGAIALAAISRSAKPPQTGRYANAEDRQVRDAEPVARQASGDKSAEGGSGDTSHSGTTDGAGAGSLPASSPAPLSSSSQPGVTDSTAAGSSGTSAAQRKLYLQMTREEQADYVARESQHIATMIGRRPCTFTPEVLGLIKYWVDAYARRSGTGQKGLWREDMRTVFQRATRYTPIVIREFRNKQINEVVGVYIPMIETEYNNICYENKAGAMGLFQFTGPTARGLGVRPEDRCDVEKMAPVAARYIADRLSEFGTDAVGVSLAIAGYNRSPDSVRRDLYNVIDPNNRERSFWTLVANKAKLDQWFQDENVSYVPRFFAAAIVGENPWDFGINMRQLSSYTEPVDQP